MELRDVMEVLEQSQIPCCVVGVSALIFYGVLRVRDVNSGFGNTETE